MNRSTVARPGTRQRLTRHLLSAVAVAITACSAEKTSAPDNPLLPDDPRANPAVQAAAWRFDINTAKRTVKITPPSGKVAGVAGGPSFDIAGVDYSLVGADVISLSATNYNATGVGTGGAPANKVRVTFDLAVTNLLTSVDLVTPTFPTPPVGLTGLFGFAFATNVTTTSGGVGTSGNDIIIDLPNTGGVTPSPNFDVAAHNWFNDTGCPSGSNDCYRAEQYPVPLPAGATSAGQQIGFDIDPTVSNFSAKIIIAADLQNSGPAITRTVSGTVTSPQLGPLSGGTVSITGGFSTSPASGNYSIANVGAGPRTVSYTPPAGCSAPASQNITISSGSPTPVVVNFTVTCTAPSGTVNGAINLASGSGSPSLSGVQVTLTPSAAGTTSATVSPTAVGAYTSSVLIGLGAGAGNGTIAFANLPAGCTFVGSSTSSWSGLAAGGTATAAPVTITCPLPQYPLIYAWGTPSGGSITLSVSIDMGVRNDPLNNGAAADNIGAFQGTITFGSRASLAGTGSCSGQSGFSASFSLSGNTLGALLTNTTGATGLVPLYTCTFSYSASGTTTLSGSGHLFGNNVGYDFGSLVNIVYNPIP
ncbi:MAG: carboxypeptidase regulatory-like domain-containing protein [Gemmatimonadales bacterium]|nr:carboxypeptidase regulatory-like domain-containing protein [Gemmatimonadales bacterium]